MKVQGIIVYCPTDRAFYFVARENLDDFPALANATSLTADTRTTPTHCVLNDMNAMVFPFCCVESGVMPRRIMTNLRRMQAIMLEGVSYQQLVKEFAAALTVADAFVGTSDYQVEPGIILYSKRTLDDMPARMTRVQPPSGPQAGTSGETRKRTRAATAAAELEERVRTGSRCEPAVDEHVDDAAQGQAITSSTQAAVVKRRKMTPAQFTEVLSSLRAVATTAQDLQAKLEDVSLAVYPAPKQLYFGDAEEDLPCESHAEIMLLMQNRRRADALLLFWKHDIGPHGFYHAMIRRLLAPALLARYFHPDEDLPGLGRRMPRLLTTWLRALCSAKFPADQHTAVSLVRALKDVRRQQ